MDLCLNCGDPDCQHPVRVVGKIQGGIRREGFLHWIAMACYEDISDSGIFTKRCLTERGAIAASKRMAIHLYRVRQSVIRAQEAGH